jgi:uncharacterized protein DUF4112
MDAEIERVKRMARILDHYLVDPLIGLVLPGAGDLIGSLLGLYTVSVAIRRKMSPVIVARMLMNLALDALVGVVPLLGDIADIAFKANERNVKLLVDRADGGGKATARDWAMIVGAALVFGAAIGLTIYALVAVIRALS